MYGWQRIHSQTVYLEDWVLGDSLRSYALTIERQRGTFTSCRPLRTPTVITKNTSHGISPPSATEGYHQHRVSPPGNQGFACDAPPRQLTRLPP